MMLSSKPIYQTYKMHQRYCISISVVCQALHASLLGSLLGFGNISLQRMADSGVYTGYINPDTLETEKLLLVSLAAKI